MPIKIQSDLPVKEILEKENIFRYISVDFASCQTSIFSSKRISFFTTRKVHRRYATI